VVHCGQIWHFRELNGAGGVAETETLKNCNSAKLNSEQATHT
jgi:hypothetical protein